MNDIKIRYSGAESVTLTDKGITAFNAFGHISEGAPYTYDLKTETVKKLVDILSERYYVSSNEDVELLTIRHYTQEILFDLTKNRYKLLEQKTRQTVQVIMK